MATVMVIAMDMALRTTRHNTVAYSFTDLHTHILPAFDDGAKNAEISANMLRIQKTNSVDRVALTPHFYPNREELDAFLARRQQAYDNLLTVYDNETMPLLKLGAEVRFDTELVGLDLHQLAIGEGKYILLELPDDGAIPCLEYVVDSIIEQGIDPVFAHIERCAAFRHDPFRLYRLVQKGVHAQISADVFLGKKKDKFSGLCIKSGLAHVIASDVHNLMDRGPCLGEIVGTSNVDILERAELFAGKIWNNDPLPQIEVKPIYRGFWGYYSV